MPAKRFFAFLGAARELNALHMIDLCDISAIPALRAEDYKKMIELFKGRIPGYLERIRAEREEKPKEQLDGAKAQQAMKGLFS